MLNRKWGIEKSLESLLSTQKLSDIAQNPPEFYCYPINEIEKDYNRIVSSAAFRRLLGYFGEATIRNGLTPRMAKDLQNFEGNLQALQILAKGKYSSGINLSDDVISTLVKCPTNSNFALFLKKLEP